MYTNSYYTVRYLGHGGDDDDDSDKDAEVQFT